MHPSRLISTLAIVLVAALAACGGAATDGQITVSDARVPVPAGPNGAAYMTLTGDGAADRLVGAETTIAERVELHESSMREGAMSMRQVDGVDIPAGGDAVLEPGGFHLMLVGVDRDLAVGDTVDITLTFERTGDQTVSADVVPPGDVQMHNGSEGMDMGSEGMDMGSEG